MHVGAGDADVTQGLGFEGADIVVLLGDEKATKLGVVGLQRELVDLFGIGGLDDADRLAR